MKAIFFALKGALTIITKVLATSRAATFLVFFTVDRDAVNDVFVGIVYRNFLFVQIIFQDISFKCWETVGCAKGSSASETLKHKKAAKRCFF